MQNSDADMGPMVHPEPPQGNQSPRAGHGRKGTCGRPFIGGPVGGLRSTLNQSHSLPRMPASSWIRHLLPPLMLWSGITLAQGGTAHPIILRIMDQDALLKGVPPRVVLQSPEWQGSVRPLDDGRTPDRTAADGSYSASIPNTYGHIFKVKVYAGDGEGPSLASGEVHFPQDAKQWDISVALTEAGARMGTSDDAVLNTGAGADGSPRSGGLWFGWQLLLVALVGLGAAKLEGVWRRRRRPPQASLGLGLMPLGDGYPTVGAGHWLLTVPEEARLQVTLEVALATRPRGPVLIVPHPAHREALQQRLRTECGEIHMLEAEAPAPSRVLRVVDELGREGRPVSVVVQGSGALEPTARGGAEALEELLRSQRAWLCILRSGHEPSPTLDGVRGRALVSLEPLDAKGDPPLPPLRKGGDPHVVCDGHLLRERGSQWGPVRPHGGALAALEPFDSKSDPPLPPLRKGGDPHVVCDSLENGEES